METSRVPFVSFDAMRNGMRSSARSKRVTLAIQQRKVLPHLEYIQLSSGDAVPVITHLNPFKCVLVAEDGVTAEWQAQISRWLVNSGCRYLMAWGRHCQSWSNSVFQSNIERHNFKKIPEASLVVTTWHKAESLSAVFWYAKYAAFHEVHELEHTIVLHLSSEDKSQQFSFEYGNA